MPPAPIGLSAQVGILGPHRAVLRCHGEEHEQRKKQNTEQAKTGASGGRACKPKEREERERSENRHAEVEERGEAL